MKHDDAGAGLNCVRVQKLLYMLQCDQRKAPMKKLSRSKIQQVKNFTHLKKLVTF